MQLFRILWDCGDSFRLLEVTQRPWKFLGFVWWCFLPLFIPPTKNFNLLCYQLTKWMVLAFLDVTGGCADGDNYRVFSPRLILGQPNTFPNIIGIFGKKVRYNHFKALAYELSDFLMIIFQKRVHMLSQLSTYSFLPHAICNLHRWPVTLLSPFWESNIVEFCETLCLFYSIGNLILLLHIISLRPYRFGLWCERCLISRWTCPRISYNTSCCLLGLPVVFQVRNYCRCIKCNNVLSSVKCHRQFTFRIYTRQWRQVEISGCPS